METLSLSYSEENYLKAIYGLSKSGLASTSSLAAHLETKASSITDMLKKLHQKGLVNYKPYQGASLTDDGTERAIYIIRKHRLWEVFLVEKLGFGWEEVHDIAEELEHIKSPKLIKKLDEFLGFPERDPHGDPIPDSEGNIPEFTPLPLSEHEAGDKVTIIGVRDSSREFLEYLDSQNIRLGDKLTVKADVPYDNSMIVVRNKQEFNLSEKICKNLLVR